MLLRLLVLVVRDSVITLSAIAYNVNNNLDEVLLAIVYTAYSGNIITRSRLFLKVAVTRGFVALGSSTLPHWYRDKLDRMLKEAEGQYPVLQHLSLKIVVFSKIQYRYPGTSGSLVSLILWDQLIITFGAFNINPRPVNT